VATEASNGDSLGERRAAAVEIVLVRIEATSFRQSNAHDDHARGERFVCRLTKATRAPQAIKLLTA
jgi:hypothetical protein